VVVPLDASEHNHVRSSSLACGEDSTPATRAPQSPRGAAARGPAQPGRSTPTKRRSTLAEGDRAPERSGRRGIRTPCSLPRVSRAEMKAAHNAAHGARGVGGEVGARGGHGATWGAFRAGGAGTAGRSLGRLRVLPHANACSWPNGAAGGGDRVCFSRVSPVSPVPKLNGNRKGARATPARVRASRNQRAAIPAFPNTIVLGVAPEWAGHSGSPFTDGAPVRMNATM